MVRGDAAEAAARALLDGAPGSRSSAAVRRHLAARHRADLHPRPAGAEAFAFNGWGGKYDLERDDTVADQIAAAAGAAAHRPRLRAGGRGARPRRRGHGADHPPVPPQPQPQSGLDRGRTPRRRWPGRWARGRCCGWTRAWPTTTPTAMWTTWPASWPRAWWPARWPGAWTIPTPGSMTPPPGPGRHDRRGGPASCRSCAFPRRAGSTDADGYVVPASHMNFIIANGAVVAPIYQERPGLLAVEALEIAVSGPRGDRPALPRPAHRRRLVPLHHPAGAGLMARTLTLAADPGRLWRGPGGQYRPDRRPDPPGRRRGRPGDPAAGAVPGPLFLRRPGGALVRRRPSLARAPLRHRPGARWPPSWAWCCRSRSSSARGRTISTAW